MTEADHRPSRWLSSLRSRSYEVLPALSVRGPELRSSLRIVTVAWMFGSVWMIAIGGATMGRFAKLMGFADIHWSIWQTVGFTAMLVQLPAAYLIERIGLRKLTFLQVTTIHRLLWMLVGLVPLSLLLFPSLAGPMIWVAMGIVFLSSVLGNIGAPAWITWMSDLIPSRIRGRYFARRNLYAVAVQIAATLALGLVLDWAVVGDPSQETLVPGEQRRLVWTVAGVFALAGLLGAVDILLFRRIREVLPPANPRQATLTEILSEPLRNRRFLHFVGAWSMLTFGIAVSGPYFVPVCQNTLGLNATWMNVVLTVCGPVGGLVSSKWWGRAIDRWGRKPVMMVGLLGAVFAVWGWLIIPGGPGVAQWITIAVAMFVTFYGGFMWTGIGIAQFNTLLGFSDERGRSAYVAATSILSALAGIGGSFVGGGLAELLDGFEQPLGPMVFVHYHVIFLISGLIRAGSMLFMVGMADPGAKPTMVMIRAFSINAYHNLTTRMLWPIRVVSASRRAAYRPTEGPIKALRNGPVEGLPAEPLDEETGARK